MSKAIVEKAQPPDVYVLGSKLSLCSLETLLQAVKNWVTSKHAALILYGNLHTLNSAYEQAWLREMYNSADVVHIDGEGARWAARFVLRRRRSAATVPPRITWAELGWHLAAFCAQHGFSVYLLGGAPGISERTAHALQAKHPALKIVGTHHGYFDMRPQCQENEEVLAEIRAAQPDILIVGFGTPRQEAWLRHNRQRLPPCICWGAGAAFDYLSGTLRRGPRWMTDNGLEWMARLLIQPRHLWRRYLIGLPLFWLRFLFQHDFAAGEATRRDYLTEQGE